MMYRSRVFGFTVMCMLFASACVPVAAPAIQVDPSDLRFSGEQAFALEGEFVSQFPNRHSGQPNNRAAAGWIRTQFEAAGLTCAIDEWQIINYSQPVTLNNVVCRLEGERNEEILVVAHHDQASTTVEGADNDASGIAILLQLAEIFAGEARPQYTLVFVSTDAEEYGMLGSRRYIQTHPDTSLILAGMSLDNLGRPYYDGMNMELIGQFRRYGPIWLALTARASAQAAGADWEVHLRAPLDQVLDQTAPISFMDQGPMVAGGVPALGFAASVPPEYTAQHYQLWHDPGDTMENQSPVSLEQSGRIAEALLRQLLSMDTFPEESGPYIYFDSSGQALRGAPLWLIFMGFVSVFLVGSVLSGRTARQQKLAAWRSALPHFLGLWLPLVAAIVLLYLFVVLGIMDSYDLYPATSKDPAIYNPRWAALIGFWFSLAIFIALGRRLVRARAGHLASPDHSSVKSLALLVIALAGVYILSTNAFSLLFLVPVLSWFAITGRRGPGRAVDISLFALGGLVFYGLFYFFGFVTYDYGFAFLWFLQMMFSIQMVSFPTAAVIMAIIAAGLSMITSPPQRAGPGAGG